MGLFVYTKKGSIISTVYLPTTEIIEPQLVAQRSVLKRAISKPVLAKRGLVSCLDYYLKRHALKVS